MKVKFNHLKNETSPYLLMHATNPVDWYPWGNEAFSIANRENKLVIVSIGYAACHWCHVMEHESFSDPEVAALMNKYFISIKVDREERPDVDQIFMEVAQRISGRGGWPLNAIALPTREPVYALTYLPQKSWMEFLQSFQNMWQTQPAQFYDQAEILAKSIRKSAKVSKIDHPVEYDRSDLDKIRFSLVNLIDPRWGGFGQAPKFPMPAGLELLMELSALGKHKESTTALETTLQGMALGGIFDRAGGGFARYSVDESWKVPHFEKMLYDNGQLASLYAHAFQLTQRPFYKEILDKTLQFIQRELTSPEGAFYSSLDADSEGEEGKFYVWSAAELQEIWGEKSELLSEYFNIREHGNWELGKNILFSTKLPHQFASAKKINADEFDQMLSWSDKQLMKAREQRVRPGLDDKILTSWNGIMIRGFVDGYKATGNQSYLEAAVKAAQFQNSQIEDDGRANRNYKDGRSSINGFLDDYAYLISAFISLFQVTFDKSWLNLALKLTNHSRDHFFDSGSGMFFFTSNLDRELVARRQEINDDVIPSSNSTMAENLFMLGELLNIDEFTDIALQMVRNVYRDLTTLGPYMANWSRLLIKQIETPVEVAIVGPDALILTRELQKKFIPGMILLGGESENDLPMLKNRLVPGKTYIYVCRNKTCRLPVQTIKEALKQIENK